MIEDIDRIRLEDIEEHIKQDLKLLKDYEEELRFETDPRRLGDIRRNIQRQHESMRGYRQEYEELNKKGISQQAQNIFNLLKQQETKLDEVQKILKPMATTEEEIFDIFICHSYLDSVWVEKLAELLENRAKLRIWPDKWIIMKGEQWQQAITREFDQTKSCAICIGEQTPKDWFQEEIGRALNHQKKDTSFQVIPVLLPNLNQVNVDDFLELGIWADFRNGLNDSLEFHRLVSYIQGVAPGRGSQEKLASESSQITVIEALIKLKIYRSDGLIDEVITHEYQRKLLDIDLFKRGKHSND